MRIAASHRERCARARSAGRPPCARVAPWQLFFQQSNVIDKRITPRFIRYERADTMLGSLVVVGGAAAVLVVAVYAVRGTSLAGHFTSALGVATALGDKSGRLGALFAIVLLDASIIGAAAVTLSTSYAFGDVFGLVMTTLFSGIDAALTALWLAVALVAGAAAAGLWLRATRSRRGEPAVVPAYAAMSRSERLNWRMPPLALLKPVQWSAGTKLGVLLLRGYLVVSVLLLIVKAVQLGSG